MVRSHAEEAALAGSLLRWSGKDHSNAPVHRSIEGAKLMLDVDLRPKLAGPPAVRELARRVRRHSCS